MLSGGEPARPDGALPQFKDAQLPRLSSRPTVERAVTTSYCRAVRELQLLVEALALRWGVTEGRFPRKTVWAELRCTPPEPTF